MNDASLAGTKLDRYFHVCAFFDSRDDEYRVLSPFYKEGLDWGEKVLTIIDGRLGSDHVKRMQELGIQVEAVQSRGQLQVLAWEEAYLNGGAFDQDQMLTTVDAVLAAGRAAGYPRSRIMGNMDWVFEKIPGSEQLMEYEARVNEVLSRTRQPAICVYDLNRLSGTMMMDILRAHPLTLVGGVVHENPFFTPPDQLLSELRARRDAAEERHSMS